MPPIARFPGRLSAPVAAAFVLATVLAGAATAGPIAPPTRLDPMLARLATASPDSRAVAWVYFTDRAGAEHDPAALAALRASWPERSLRRRMLRGVKRVLDASDLPVHAPYVRALEARGLRVRGTSRWLDAASVEGPAALVADLARLPFVARVAPVPVGWPTSRDDRLVKGPVVAPQGSAARGATAGAELVPGDASYYGGSLRQLEMMQVPQLHALGLSGAGVLVCMIDTGFETTHQVYAGLNLLATRDFIHGDTNVGFDAIQDSSGENSHGTATLACVAGSLPGLYSGVAYGATVALAMTEDVGSETPVEMDYWLFAAEWADSLGADVISSSLGYSTFDGPWPSYTYGDMDGRTTAVTLAAIEAIQRGITVVTSAGNERQHAWHYITAPADADTLIAVAAVDSSNKLAWFSSAGPAADGRIKPDVSAMGVSVMTVSPSSDVGYVWWHGTSFACPLTAGVVALLLEGHPAWGPYEVREALRTTALNHLTPNDDIGWGLVQGLAAYGWTPGITGAPGPAATARVALSAGPNPLRAGDPATVTFAAPGAGPIAVDVMDVSGRRRARLFEGAADTPARVSWRGTDSGGRTLAAGVYWIRLASEDGSVARTQRVVLLD